MAERTKTVILYKIFANNASAAAEGFDIKGAHTRRGTRYGKKVTVSIKKPIKAEINELAGLFESFGMSNAQAEPLAQAIAAAPGQQLVTTAPAAGWGGEAVVEVDVDGLVNAIGHMGLKGGKKRRHTKHRKTHRRKSHKKHTRRHHRN